MSGSAPAHGWALVWRTFREGWRGNARELWTLLVGSALVAVGHASFTALWKLVLDGAAEGDAVPAGLLLVGVGAAQVGLYVVVQGTRTRMNNHLQRKVRDVLFARVVGAAPGEVERFRAGDVLARLTDDLSDDKMGWFLCSGVFRAYEALLVAIACVVGLVWVSPWLALACLAPLPLLVLTYLGVGPRIGRAVGVVQAAVSRVTTVAHDSFDGVRVLQARGLVPLAERAFAAATAAQSAAEVRALAVQQLMFLQFSHGWQLALAALLVAGSHLVSSGALSPGDVVVASGFVMTLVFQTFDFAAFVVRGRVTVVALGRVEELRRMDQGEVRPAVPVLGPTVDAGYLRLQLPSPLSLVAGELFAVTGPVGAGKTTLVRALVGELRGEGAGEAPREGGSPPTAEPAGTARVAWAPQDPILVSATLRENVALGASVDVAAAAQGALLDPSVWPGGLDTLVGDKGLRLSGGQQQRVQIARVLAHGADVCVLDDATSALDPELEARFWDELPRDGRTWVVVTHRPATLARADRVLYLRGEVALVDTHAGLLTRSAAYAEAYG